MYYLKKEQNQENYECYYCDTFTPTNNRNPMKNTLQYNMMENQIIQQKQIQKKYNLKPQGKSWEI